LREESLGRGQQDAKGPRGPSCQGRTPGSGWCDAVAGVWTTGVVACEATGGRMSTAAEAERWDGGVRYVTAGSPAEFLAILGKFLDDFGADAVFRGHANADWPLLPSARRHGSRGDWSSPEEDTQTGSHLRQVMFEMDVLGTFVRTAEINGIPVPEAGSRYIQLLHGEDRTHALRQRQVAIRDGSPVSYDEFFERATWEWPASEIWPLVATAQHHGVPTSLLDWSYDPNTACYFACKEAMRRMACQPAPAEASRFLAVWMMRRGAVESLPYSWAGLRLEFVHAPGHYSPNIPAQKGLFTVVRSAESPRDSQLQNGAPPPLANHPELADIVRLVGKYSGDPFFADGSTRRDLLTCVKLASKHAPNLFQTLSRRGVSAATIMPGLDGVVESMREQRWLDRWRASVGSLAGNAGGPRSET
jgi:hypothetical protein